MRLDAVLDRAARRDEAAVLQLSRRVTDLTDQQGRFRLDGVATEIRWVVLAESEEYVQSESKPFTLKPGEKKELEFKLLDRRARALAELGRPREAASAFDAALEAIERSNLKPDKRGALAQGRN